MKSQTIRKIGIGVLVLLWAALALTAWLKPPEEISDAERRKLAQLPSLSVQTIQSGEFMTEFEDYTLDQFPARDLFRKVKSLFHYYVMRQKDNNGIYISGGYAAEMEYPLNEGSVSRSLKQFGAVYDRYLRAGGSRIVATVVPDKGYYLARRSGHLSMDYEKLFDTVRAAMPWATYVDITDCLQLSDYYRTDTHWRQERIFPVAQKLCAALEAPAPAIGSFTQTALERTFYGVYYGQAALPMDGETMYLMESPTLSRCTVYNHATGARTAIYDMQMVTDRDLYNVYLSGPQSLLTIENPDGDPGRELIIFRDSFGSSLAPLLAAGYGKVTLVDIRYINVAVLDKYLDFHGQDVLFMYSALVLNKNLIK